MIGSTQHIVLATKTAESLTSVSNNQPQDTPASSVDAQDGYGVAVRVVKDYVRPHLSKILQAVFFMIILSATTASLAFLLGPTLQQIFITKDAEQVKFLPLAVLVIMLVQAAATYGQAKILTYVGQRIVADMQSGLFQNIICSDQARLARTHSGNFISSFIYDTSRVQDAISQSITGLGKNLLTLIGLVGVMIYRDWQLAFIAIIIFPFLAKMTQGLGKRMRRAAQSGMDETGNLTRLVSESLSGSRTIKAYNQEQSEIDRVARSIEKRLTYIMAGIKARIKAAPISEAITAFAVSGVLALAGYRALQNTLSLEDFMSFLGAMLFAYQPARSLSQLHVALNEGIVAARRVFTVIDVQPDITDPSDGKKLELSENGICFDNVHFAYGDGTAALNGLDLDVPAGQTVAIVGPSGAGKSTVFNLIPRFYDVSSGTLTIDGQDVRSVTLSSLRDHIAIVTQEPFLFDDTIHANIAYGRPGASDADITAAAKTAAAHHFICDLSDGYNTYVGEQGTRLSGGQRQRIAIARAMLADAPILLLDEATSALDNESEQKVQDALHKLMEGRTTVVIAHRLSTIMDADMIYVLDKGRVVESGRHQELMNKNGLYARLASMQFSADDAVSAKPLAALAEKQG